MAFKPIIVPPADPPEREKLRQRIKAMPKPAKLLECRCGGREFIKAKSGVMLKDGKATGGKDVLLCVFCLAKGERVVVA